MYLSDSFPIIACSTGEGVRAAISTLRISGDFKAPSFLKYFKGLKAFKPRYAHFAKLVSPESNDVYDEVIVTYFDAPKSFTGENILEISLHGNPLNVERILHLFCNDKAVRMAKPGEFTLRALQNKKMSLSQVEGLETLLNATSFEVISRGMKDLQGELEGELATLYQLFLRTKQDLEILIDFSDDVGEEDGHTSFLNSLFLLKEKITSLYTRSRGDADSLLLPTIAIYGKPNSGKSTLFNRLLKSERAIVSSTPGTTRDFLSESFFSRNVQYRLLDTAGIRVTDNEIEREGVLRAKSLTEKSFFKVLLVNPIDKNSSFTEIENEFSSKKIDCIVLTHADKYVQKIKDYILEYSSLAPLVLASGKDGPIEPRKDGPIEPKKDGPIEPKKAGPIEPEGANPQYDRVKMEAQLLSSLNYKYLSLAAKKPIIATRQKLTITRAYEGICHFSDLASQSNDVAILSHALAEVETSTAEMIGIITPNDVLSSIFLNFCIGK